jgi:hypothetical protein
MKGVKANRREPFLELILPVFNHRQGENKKSSSRKSAEVQTTQKGNNLDGFTQTHIIGEESTRGFLSVASPQP